MVEHLIESFSWFRPELKTTGQTGNKLRIRGKAIFPTISGNNREYIARELELSARTLANVPIDVNHEYDLWESLKVASEEKGMPFTVPAPKYKGNVSDAEWDDNCVEYAAEINNPEYVAKIKDRQSIMEGNMTREEYKAKWGKEPIYGVSISASYRYADTEGDKTKPHGLMFRRLSLVEDPERPGVKGTTISVMETQGIHEESLEEASAVNLLLRDVAPSEVVEAYRQEVMDKMTDVREFASDDAHGKSALKAAPSKPIAKETVVEAPKVEKTLSELTGFTEAQLGEPFANYKNFADCVAKNKDKGDANAYCGAIKHKVEDAKAKESEPVEEKVLDAKARKEIPHGEFAYVDKDGVGHLPIEDEAHIRNAMARFNQTDMPPDAKAGAKAKICSAAKKHGIDASGFCGAKETDPFEGLDEINKKIDAEASEKKVESKVNAAIEALRCVSGKQKSLEARADEADANAKEAKESLEASFTQRLTDSLNPLKALVETRAPVEDVARLKAEIDKLPELISRINTSIEARAAATEVEGIKKGVDAVPDALMELSNSIKGVHEENILQLNGYKEVMFKTVTELQDKLKAFTAVNEKLAANEGRLTANDVKLSAVDEKLKLIEVLQGKLSEADLKLAESNTKVVALEAKIRLPPLWVIAPKVTWLPICRLASLAGLTA